MAKKTTEKKSYIRTFFKIFLLTGIVGLCLVTGAVVGVISGIQSDIGDMELDTFNMDYSSQIFYIDSKGQEQLLTTLSSEQNRIWVDLENVPENLKDAIVAIEDERFYTHSGFDLKRTSKAFFVFLKNKIIGEPTSFGGSTITQQLVKNLTQNTDRTASRKVKEIAQAIRLEKQISKDKILELYLNSIYLSQGCNGVHTASEKFFGKKVSELNLAECASIAGITQYPSLYDPIVNPEKNKQKQEVVLKKMLDLGYITNEEYKEAVDYELNVTKHDPINDASSKINSYFVDQIIYDITEDLTKKGYSKTAANHMIYSGGLKIVATIDPNVQSAMEKVFENTSNFPNSTGADHAQSSMIVVDPANGEIKGIVGGIGKKEGNLVLNRASQTLRQPGSTIKPIAVYAPALEEGLISPASIFNDKATSYSGWTPRNYDHSYIGNVSVRYALKRSLNTVPVEILKKMTPEKSFDFLTNKLGITSLVRSETASNGSVYSDIGLSQLALGGLTHGMSVRELTGAYIPFANGGVYTRPHSYSVVYDATGQEILNNSGKSVSAMSSATAYVTSMMLREVVTSGTGAGAQLPSGIFTAGKTGTTSDNHDRWFVGYTPHYVAAVWYGYDSPKPIYASGNPCISVWRQVMTEIHLNLPNKTLVAPSTVKYIKYCGNSGLLVDEKKCTGTATSFWFTDKNIPKTVCTGHNGQTDGEELKKEPETKTQTQKRTESSGSGTTKKMESIVKSLVDNVSSNFNKATP